MTTANPSTQNTPCVGNPPGKASELPMLVLAAQGYQEDVLNLVHVLFDTPDDHT